MSLENLFLVFEGSLFFFDTPSFLITVLFPHLLWERRRDEELTWLKHWPGKQAFFPQPNP